MTRTPPDRSRDRRIEDRTNLWLIHPAAHALLGPALAAGVSANMVSLAGFGIGAGAAVAFYHWHDQAAVLAGLLLTIAWLVFDGLDGMVARATGTASALGRMLDGLCDHGVFVLIYLALAFSVGTREGWALAVAAGIAHAIQSNLYESERTRFHRRARGDSGAASPARTRNPLEQLYDRVSGGFDRLAAGFDTAIRDPRGGTGLGEAYARRAVPAMRLLTLLSANMRVWLIVIACLIGDPRLFWWIEIVPMTLIAIAGFAALRRIESTLVAPGARARSIGT